MGVSSACRCQLTLLLSALLHNSNVTVATKVLSLLKISNFSVTSAVIATDRFRKKKSWLHIEHATCPHPLRALEKMKGRVVVLD